MSSVPMPKPGKVSDAIRPKMYAIPAGTPPSRCSGSTCGAVIYWTRNPATGRPMPVSCDVEGGVRPSETKDEGQLDAFGGEAAVHDGLGVSHFTNCSDVEEFSHRGARR